ncbi:Lcl domain-containing protein [Niabella hirudinis]|uniref:Lcl domain-containing protein n=1 Tax=Niabella hirudinis TaxID=1285929 RepID=UPI003EBE3D00
MKKMLLILLHVLFITACKKDMVTGKPQEEIIASVAAKNSDKSVDKITIWHFGANKNTWKQISINSNAWPDHQAHGDIWEAGQDYKGGKIGYILNPGDLGYDANIPHGFIAAPSDQGSGIPWAPIGTFAFLGTSDALGTGAANTKKIVDYYGDGNYAAKLCADLVLNGHDDWYLPSLAELNILYVNRFAIGGFDTNTNDIPNSYWSSTENDYTSAWFKFFNFGYQTTVSKYDSYRHNVRAIRSF